VGATARPPSFHAPTPHPVRVTPARIQKNTDGRDCFFFFVLVAFFRAFFHHLGVGSFILPAFPTTPFPFHRFIVAWACLSLIIDHRAWACLSAPRSFPWRRSPSRHPSPRLGLPRERDTREEREKRERGHGPPPLAPCSCSQHPSKGEDEVAHPPPHPPPLKPYQVVGVPSSRPLFPCSPMFPLPPPSAQLSTRIATQHTVRHFLPGGLSSPGPRILSLPHACPLPRPCTLSPSGASVGLWRFFCIRFFVFLSFFSGSPVKQKK